MRAALDGFGLAFVPEEQVQRCVEDGPLLRVLEDWCAVWPGYHLCYPSRRQMLAALALVVDALRYRG